MSSLTEHPAAWTRTDVPEGLGLGTLLPEPDGHRLEAGETVVEGEERLFAPFSLLVSLLLGHPPSPEANSLSAVAISGVLAAATVAAVFRVLLGRARARLGQAS